ncbi:MAG: diacylglycerol O-acyltransferase 1 [Vezdaea aestivalis]|nr:MAG: diacylglycerol O-acyltransferase 1 [Vezdaea aestivalis]
MSSIATESASLNPEPSDPQERKERSLPPKTYSDAVEEEPQEKLVPEHIEKEESSKRQDTSKNGKKTTSQKKKSKGNKKNTSGQVAGPKAAETDATKLVQENYSDTNGKSLTSVKPSEGYEQSLRSRKGEQKPPKTEQSSESLVSGRKAGAGWERSRFRFAPLNVPLQRRLQTFLVLLHTLSVALWLTSFFLLCAIPLAWPILLPYLVYCLVSSASTSGTLSHRSPRLRSSRIWSLFASYFPARLHRSAPLPPTRKYILGYHPHGIISHGAFAAFATETLGFAQLFPGITNTLLTLDSNFRIPLYRDYALAMGLASVSRESCENLLSRGGPNGEGMGRAITIVVGGAAESLDAQPGSLRLVLRRRQGFVRLAIRTGADLVPVLAFGENDLYDQVQPTDHPYIHRVQLIVKKILGFTVPLFHARGVFNYDVGMMPYRRSLNVVVGKPIMVEQFKEPSKEQVDRLHGLYMTELQRLWDEWKDTFAKDRKGEMEFVE